MRNWHFLLTSSLTALLVACGSSQNDGLQQLPTLSPTEVSGEQSSDPFNAVPLNPIVASGESLSAGRLAFIGDDNNLHILTAGSSQLTSITDDASPVIAGSAREYDQPTWSTGGWLSFVEFEVASGQPARQSIHAVLPGSTPRALFESTQSAYIYGYWAPVPCRQGPDCGRFAYLVSGSAASLELRMAQVRSDSQQVERSLLGEGGPFYYSWSPDGESMLWHVDGDTLSVIDVNGERTPFVLPDQPGAFQAPWWSPVDGRLMFAGSSGEGNQLIVLDGSERIILPGGNPALSAFAWSPDGSMLAHSEGFAPSAYPYRSLSVFSANGQRETVLIDDAQIWAYFWSPDSRHLAIVTVELRSGEQASVRAPRLAAPAPQQAVLVWNVADVNTGEVRPLAEFIPTRSQQNMFQFFDQFAQSHSFWSPDSQQIVFAQVLSNGDEAISVIDALDPAATPQFVAPGSIAIFSYN